MPREIQIRTYGLPWTAAAFPLAVHGLLRRHRPGGTAAGPAKFPYTAVAPPGESQPDWIGYWTSAFRIRPAGHGPPPLRRVEERIRCTR
jgi:hypothetical protein